MYETFMVIYTTNLINVLIFGAPHLSDYKVQLIMSLDDHILDENWIIFFVLHIEKRSFINNRWRYKKKYLIDEKLIKALTNVS